MPWKETNPIGPVEAQGLSQNTIAVHAAIRPTEVVLLTEARTKAQPQGPLHTVEAPLQDLQTVPTGVVLPLGPLPVEHIEVPVALVALEALVEA